MAPKSRISSFSLLLFCSATLIPQVAAFTQCYYPDGSIPTDVLYEPCSGTGHSACCDSIVGDVCQDNGLCYYAGTGTNNTYRGTCTDRTWNDPACPNICVTGHEDEWIWTTPCSTKDSSDPKFACGFRDEDDRRLGANCTGGATKDFEYFRTEATTSSKATRYTSPPAVDTKKFTVYTETYTTEATAEVYYTTLTTTWESTITSAFAQESGTASDEGPSITGTRGGLTRNPTSSPSESASSAPPPASSGLTISPGVLGAAIAGPILLIGLIAGIFFFIRKKRAAKDGSGMRLGSSPAPSAAVPPPNGPVGRDQVTPYEVPANETSAPGAFAPDKKYLYTPPGGANAGAYEMSSAGEKGWGGHGAAEVSGDSTPQRQWAVSPVSPAGTPQPVRSPAPVYSHSGHAPMVMPVELDGGDYSRPNTARNGVGNA